MNIITGSEFILNRFNKSRIKAMQDIAELIVQGNEMTFTDWETKKICQERVKQIIDIDEHEFWLSTHTKDCLMIDNERLADWARKNNLRVLTESHKHITIQF
jgi:hypothetical protein